MIPVIDLALSMSEVRKILKHIPVGSFPLFINSNKEKITELTQRTNAWELLQLNPLEDTVLGFRSIFYRDTFTKEINATVDAIYSRDPKVVKGLLQFSHSKTYLGFDFDGSEFFAQCLTRLKEKKINKIPNKVIIVGAGIAAAFATRELIRRNVSVVVFDAGCTIASGASALYAGLCHPHWQVNESNLFAITRMGFLKMQKCLEENEELFISGGVLEIAKDKEKWNRWQEKSGSFSNKDLARLLDRKETESILGISPKYGSIFMPKAGLVYSSKLVRKFLSQAKVYSNTKIEVEKSESGWLAKSNGVVLEKADAVILAAGKESPLVAKLPESWFGINALYGRISLLKDTDLNSLKLPYTGGGYGAHLKDGFVGIGATYEDKGNPLTEVRAHQENIKNMQSLLGDISVTPCAFYEGIRAVAHDRLPMAGVMMSKEKLANLTFKGVPEIKAIPVEEGLFGVFALGSRGLTWGLLCAQMVVAKMMNEPLAVSRQIEGMLDPRRYYARHIAKKEKV